MEITGEIILDLNASFTEADSETFYNLIESLSGCVDVDANITVLSVFQFT